MCRKGQKPLILPDAFDGEVVAWGRIESKIA
jgi:hypothetical protein